MLVIGGPLHGQDKEVPEGESGIVSMAMGPDNTFQAVQYTVRGIQAQTQLGKVYQQYLLVESTLTVEIATQALAALLLEKFAQELVRQFMEGGELIADDEGSGSGLFGD